MDKYKHLHNFQVSELFHNNYNELIISNTLRTFALSLISLFMPIFLIKLGYEIRTIFVLEILMLSFSFWLHFFVFRVIRYLGIKRTLVLSYITTILFYGILYNASGFIDEIGRGWFLVLMGGVNVCFTTLYWVAQHLYFVKSTKKENSGKRYGVLIAVPMFLGIVSPFAGSALITTHGFEVSFLVAIFIMVLAGIVMFFTDEIVVDNNKMDLKKIWKGSDARLNAMYFIEGVNVIATGFMWPLILFMMKFQLMFMGLLYLVSNTIFAIISVYGGKFTDIAGPKKMVAIGSIGHGFSLIFRAYAKTVWFITGFQSMGGFFGALWTVSFKSNFYKKSHDDPVNSIMNMEVYQHLGRIFVFVFIFFLSGTYSIMDSFLIVLVFSGVLTFGFSVLISE
ncbi:MFS transporter [Candidatus Parcubacteria bacterium]|nr:MFS transporter [Candidatus Parcubacteria bacterium]